MKADEALVHLLSHRAWTDSIEPALRKLRDTKIAVLIKSDGSNDEYLKAYIRALSWMLEWPRNQVDAVRALEEAMKEPVEEAAIGSIYGIGPDETLGPDGVI